MATNWNFQVHLLDGEVYSDQVNSDMRGQLETYEQSEELNLGPRVGTRKDPDLENVRYYYYHNGRITVSTRYDQLTDAQRQGRRSY
jgi:hypothetical protein